MHAPAREGISLAEGADDDYIRIQNEMNKYLGPNDIKQIMNTKNNGDISIVYLNIGSLPKHIDELQNFLSSANCYPSIIALAETKITDTVNSDFHPHLENYEYFNVPSSIYCGGVCVFIKSGVNYERRLDLEMWQSKMWETLWLEVDFNKTKNFIGVVYRHNGEADILLFSRTLEKKFEQNHQHQK